MNVNKLQTTTIQYIIHEYYTINKFNIHSHKCKNMQLPKDYHMIVELTFVGNVVNIITIFDILEILHKHQLPYHIYGNENELTIESLPLKIIIQLNKIYIQHEISCYKSITLRRMYLNVAREIVNSIREKRFKLDCVDIQLYYPVQ